MVTREKRKGKLLPVIFLIEFVNPSLKPSESSFSCIKRVGHITNLRFYYGIFFSIFPFFHLSRAHSGTSQKFCFASSVIKYHFVVGRMEFLLHDKKMDK